MEDGEQFWAHSANDAEKWQSQKEHIEGVTERAIRFASAWGGEEEAECASLLHDIGKYSERFQRRLRGEGSGLDHWSAGAWIALKDFQHVPVALSIQGHHIGLQRGNISSLRQMQLERINTPETHPQQKTLTETNVALMRLRLETDGFVLKRPSEKPVGSRGKFCDEMLDTRMLFSALVDADFLDTEAHFSKPRKDGITIDPQQAFDALAKLVAKLEGESTSSLEVQSMRSDLWNACIEKGTCPTGLFTLTAPTGAGKTLSMLGFALQHAIHQPVRKEAKEGRFPRRIIVVVPYLSITDQTADIYKKLLCPIFGNEVLIEHHSLAGTRERSRNDSDEEVENDFDAFRARQRERTLSENWDAPIILTTSVQFLESLFSNRSSATRKLHSLANSIILMDEVQTMPHAIVVPTLSTLGYLSKRYGATVVFSTATQPAFTNLNKSVRELGTCEWQTTEIVPVELKLFERARRATVEWPDKDKKISWADLATELKREHQVIAIVNLKRHARNLIGALQQKDEGETLPEILHLSTSMCPAHRRRVIDKIRSYTQIGGAEKAGFILVSTQCIEAGVDLDVPVLYRAFGPLTAIAQAAGRCNRAGKLDKGRVVVFHPDEEGSLYPPGEYINLVQVTKMMLERSDPNGLDIYDPELFTQFYRSFYAYRTEKQELIDAIKDLDYVETARRYRVISEDSVNVLVPYVDSEKGLGVYRELEVEAMTGGLTASWVRRARPYTVSLYRPTKPDDNLWRYLTPIPVLKSKGSDDWFVYNGVDHYDPLLGLLPPPASSFWFVG